MKVFHSLLKHRKLAIIFFTVIVALVVALLVITKNDSGSKILTKEESSFGPVWIFEENGQRCMTFIKPPTPIIQSCLLVKNPKIILGVYARVFLGTLFFNDNPQRVLVIGLGGANIQKAFNILLPRAQIDTVEINPMLPKIVEQYFFYKEDARNKIFIEDGAVFAENAGAKIYDIILIDAFNADYIPPQFLTNKFMQNVKKMLKQNGFVAINTFANSNKHELESDLFKNNFGEYYNVVVGGSRVMIAAKSNLLEFNEIASTSILWRYKFAEVGVDSNALLEVFKEAPK